MSINPHPRRLGQISQILLVTGVLSLTTLLASALPNPNPQIIGREARQDRAVDSLGGMHDTPENMRRMAKALNELRQKQLKSDAQKLLTLANEFKAETDKSGTLSDSAQKKAEQIEKLARKVRNGMIANNTAITPNRLPSMIPNISRDY